MIYFLLITLIPMLIIGIISNIISKNSLEEAIIKHLNDLSRDCGRKISFFIDARYSDIAYFSQAHVFKTGNIKAQQAIIDETIKECQYYDVIHLIDKDGEIIASSERSAIGELRDERENFQEALKTKQGDVFFREPYYSKASGNYVIGFMTPITDAQNKEVIKVLATRVKMDFIISRIHSLDTRTVGKDHTWLLNSKAQILAGPNKDDFLNKHRLCDYKVIKELLAGKNGIIKYTNDKGENVISSKWALKGEGDFDGWGWGIIVTELESKAFAAVYQLRNIVFISFVVISVLVIILIIVVSGNISNPIKQITSVVDKVAKGDLSIKIESFKTGDEIEELAISFNKMTEDLVQAEEKLKESEEKCRLIVENSAESIALIDKTGKYLFLNNASAKLLNGVPEDIIGKSLHDTFPEKQADEMLNSIYEVIKSKKGLYGETKVTVNSGERWYLANVQPCFDISENINAAVVISTDITDRKEAENELKKSREHLRELNTTKNKFFSLLGHDLRSPFNSIIGFSEILYNETEAFSKAEIKKIAEGIYNTSRETYNLLNNLLEWSGTQTGRIKFEPVKTGIYDIVISTVDLLNDTAKKKDISVSVDIPEHLQVFADRNMTTTVVRNLLSNAIKFTHKKGSIKIGAQDTGKSVEIFIADTGVGIKPEDIKKLFRIDASFSKPGTAKEKGTGLGLIICKEFIAINNGDIRVESEIGKGSRFIVRLPKGEEEVES